MSHEYIEGCLTLSEPIDVSDIEVLLSCDPNQSITLWSLQQAGFIEELKERGRLTGNPKYAYSEIFVSPGKKGAYEWLQGYLANAVPGYDGALVVWASPFKPNTTTRRGDRIIRLNVKRSRLIFTWYSPWVELLELMRTSPAGFLPSHARAEAFEHERAAREAVEQGFPEPRALNVVAAHLPSRSEVLVTMPRMFDLTLARQPGFLWMDGQGSGQPPVLQALLLEVFWSDIQGDPVDAEIDPVWQ